MLMVMIAALSAVLFFIFFVACKKRVWSTIVGITFAIIMMVSLGFSIANECYHYGLVKTTETKVYRLESVADNKDMPLSMLMKQPIDKDGHLVYIYKTDNKKKTQKTSVDSNVSNHVVHTSGPAQFVQTKTYYSYKNKWMKLLFAYPASEREITHISNTFKINDQWLVMTPAQVKALGQTLKEQKDTLQKEVQEQVKTKLTAKMKEEGHPLSQSEIKTLSEQYARTAMMEKIQSIISTVK